MDKDISPQLQLVDLQNNRITAVTLGAVYTKILM
jgi:hypothetical protein